MPLFARGGEETPFYWRNRAYPEKKMAGEKDLASVNLKKERECQGVSHAKSDGWPRISSTRRFKALTHGALVTEQNSHGSPCTAGWRRV